MKWPAVLLLSVVAGCAYQVTGIDVRLPDGFYEPYREKGFCWSGGNVSNVQQGTWMSSEMPVCAEGDIVIHTHPAWAEQLANFIDEAAWDEYRARYGNELFGVCGDGWCKIYRRAT